MEYIERCDGSDGSGSIPGAPSDGFGCIRIDIIITNKEGHGIYHLDGYNVWNEENKRENDDDEDYGFN